MKKLRLLAFVAVLLLFSTNIHAQSKFRDIESKEGVSFSYRWKHEKKSKKERPMIFIVKITNSNEYKTEVQFTIDYFYQALRKASSEEQLFCVKPKKALVGDVKKIGFDRASFTNEQLLSDEFIVEFSGIVIKKSPDCKQRK